MAIFDDSTEEGKKALGDLIKKAAKDAIDEAVETATEGLANKNKELLGELKKLKRNKDADPEEVTRLETELDTVRADLDKAKKDAKKLATDNEALGKQYKSESEFTQRLLVDNGLTEQLVAAGVAKEYLPAVKALLAGKVAVVTDGDNRAAKVGDKPLADFIKEWSQGDEGKHYISAPANSGGGAPGSNSPAGGGKKISRADFDQLGPQARMDHVKAGGTIVDN